MKNHTKKIAEIIQGFLENEGGLGNGYDTWVRGEVLNYKLMRLNGLGGISLEWKTPEKENLTIKIADKKGQMLYQQLQDYIVENNLGHLVIFTDEHGTAFYFKGEATRVPSCRDHIAINKGKPKEIVVGSIVSYTPPGQSKPGWFRVRRCSKNKVNLGAIFGRTLYHKGVPKDEVKEDEEAWYAEWTKSETYKSM